MKTRCPVRPCTTYLRRHTGPRAALPLAPGTTLPNRRRSNPRPTRHYWSTIHNSCAFIRLIETFGTSSSGSSGAKWVTKFKITNHCLAALRHALSKGRPTIFNTDQGAQFTADAFITCLQAANIQVSMDGRGRALDNIFCERLWRSVKYENIYLNQYDSVHQLQDGLEDYFVFYNQGWVGEGTSCLN